MRKLGWPVFLASLLVLLWPSTPSHSSRNPYLDEHLKSLGSDSPYRKDIEEYGPSLRDEVEIPHSGLFQTPANFKTRVEFWKNIYSKYTTGKVVMHDRDNLAIIYEVIDIEKAFGGKKISDKTKSRFIKKSEKRVAAVLRKIYRNKGVATTAYEKKIAAALIAIPGGRSKYSKAAKKVRAQVGQADRFREGLVRSGRYLVHIRKILKKNGLPQELAVLPHVESSFNYQAYSSAGAAGIWQFTRSTGRLFMRINYAVDERRDPISSTEAAARLLKQNYESLGSWPLAITAYNHGAGGMKRAKKKHGADLATIIDRYKSRTFGFASKNFYAEFLAALEVAHNYRNYFGELRFEPSSQFEMVMLNYYVSAKSLASNMGLSIDTLKVYNPALRPSVWSGRRHIPKGYRLKTPLGMKQAALAALASIPSSGRASSQRSDGFHVVRKGDTLSTIARRNRISLVSLRNENSIWTDKIRVGQKLRLPPKATTRKIKIPKRTTKPAPGEKYTVRQGDNLTNIARSQGISLASLRALNGLKGRSTIHPGQKLILATDNQPIATIASIASAKVATQPVRERATEETIALPEPAPTGAPEAYTRPVITDEGESVTVNGRTLELRADKFSVIDSGKNLGRITVETEETLGHYAEWLRVSQKTIQRMNIRYNLKRTMPSGIQLKIPLSRVTAKEFERKRFEYHMELLEDYFEAYKVDGEQDITIHRGQSLWDLCVKENDVPLWLFTLYNPETDIHRLKPGDKITLPLISKR